MNIRTVIKQLCEQMPPRKVRKFINKDLRKKYLEGILTKREYKQSKKKLKVLLKEL